MRKLDYVVLDLLESTARNIKAQPVNLGGVSGEGGGVGGPPGGFIGWLPQTRVAYDTNELASSGITGSGTLLDNLNHIRYRIQTLESGTLVVDEYDGSPSVSPVNRITFSGAAVTVMDAGGGRAIVSITASGGGGGGIPEAPEDGNTYGREDAAWVDLDLTYLRLDTANDPLTNTLQVSVGDLEAYTAFQTIPAGTTSSAVSTKITRQQVAGSQATFNSYVYHIVDTATPAYGTAAGLIYHYNDFASLAMVNLNPYAGNTGSVFIVSSYNDISENGRLFRLQNQAADKFTVNGVGTVNIPTGQTYNIGGSPHSHSGWEVIADQTKGSSGATFDFSSIASTYKSLEVWISGRTDRAGQIFDGVTIRFNNDSTNGNYEYVIPAWFHNNQYSTTEDVSATCNYVWITTLPGATATANFAGQGVIFIPDYAGTTFYKSLQCRGSVNLGTGTGRPRIYDGIGTWKSTAAVNRITIGTVNGSNFIAGSRCILLGMK